jgi:uncharacterized integral membrane protein
VWRKLVSVLIILPIAVVLVALAVANRAPVDLVLDPIGHRFVVSLPLFILILAAFAAGLLVGGFATWMRQGKWRKMARKSGRESKDLRRQSDRLEQELQALQSAPRTPRLPAD